jgi:RimJ/RimL family protein N-acetyltransferase
VDITFRPLTDDDLPLLHRWLNDPGVVRWWEGDDVSWEGVVRDYGGGGDGPEEHYLALLDGEPVGWIQCGSAAHWPDESAAWRALGLDPAVAGIDYLVGEPAARGRSLGSRMIRAFVDDVVFGRHPGWTQAAADPDVDNVASWRALAKAGFRHVGDIPSGKGTGRLMAIDRPPAPGAGRAGTVTS